MRLTTSFFGLLLVPALLLSLATVAGAQTINQGQSYNVSATSSFNHSPQQLYWNVIGITSDPGSDYDVSVGTTTSDFSGSAADFVIADGTNGTVSAPSGLVTRYSGSGFGYLQHATTTPSSSTYNWSVDDVVHIFESYISTPGQYDVRINTPSNSAYRWFGYAPRGNAAWVRRSDANVGPFTTNSTQRLSIGATGYFAWVLVVEDGAAPSGICSASVTPVMTSQPQYEAVSATSTVQVATGAPFVVETMIRNAGNAAGTCDFDLYLSTDGDLSFGDYLVGQYTSQPISANSTSTQFATAQAVSVPPGYYYVHLLITDSDAGFPDTVSSAFASVAVTSGTGGGGGGSVTSGSGSTCAYSFAGSMAELPVYVLAGLVLLALVRRRMA